MSSAKKLISTNLAIFGFFPSKKHDPIGIINFCLNRLEKITKNNKIMINIFYSIFCIFLKTHRFWLSLLCRNEFCMQKYPNKHISIGFAENSHLWLSFCKGKNSFTLWAKKFISTHLAIFGFFPSKKHDPIGIINFCLKLLEKITKIKK